MAHINTDPNYKFVSIPAFLYHEPLGFSVDNIKGNYFNQLQYDVDKHRNYDSKSTFVSITSNENQKQYVTDSYTNSHFGVRILCLDLLLLRTTKILERSSVLHKMVSFLFQVKTSKLHPMEPVSELEISRQEQKSDSAYSSHVTPNQRITPALSGRSPAHSSRSPAHSRHRSNSPKKIIFEGRHPPSSYVGLYTQLDLLPQKLVYENEPVQAEVDAKNDGPHTDIVPAKVHHLRDLYLNKVDDGVVPTTEIIVTNDYYQPAQQAHDNERKLKVISKDTSVSF